jgi:hypothetical protein
MSAPKITAAEIRAQLAAAETALHHAKEALAQATYQALFAGADASPQEQDAVDAAQRQVDKLRAVLPIAEKSEAAALAATRAKLAEEQRKGLEKVFRDLVKHAIGVSVAAQNTRSAWLRLVRAGEEASRLLFDEQRQVGRGNLARRLGASELRRLCDQEINRLGLLPDFQGGISAPGTNTALVDLNFKAKPQQLPSLEGEIKALIAALMRHAPFAEPQESGKDPDLSQIAKAASGPSASPVEAPETLGHAGAVAEETA